jgi:hypothetical protein
MAFYNAYAGGSGMSSSHVGPTLFANPLLGAEFYAGEELSRERNRAQLNTSDHFVDMTPDGGVSGSQTLPVGSISDSVSLTDTFTPQWSTSIVEQEEPKVSEKLTDTKKRGPPVWLFLVSVPVVGGLYWLLFW